MAPLSTEEEETFVDLYAVRRFHAHLSEALERNLAALLRGLADEILARELTLAPVDVKALLDTSLQRFRHLDPLRVRVHPDDVRSLGTCGVSVFADGALARGDVCIDLKNGSIDLTLPVRMQALLESVNAR